MDIFLRKLTFFLAFWVLLLVPDLAEAQVGLTQHKMGFKNRIIKIWANDFSNDGFVFVEPEAQHGTIVDVVDGPNEVDTIYYLPDEDFLGTDEFAFEHYTDYPSQVKISKVRTTVKIQVVPSYVEVEHDYGITQKNEPTILRIISNDSTTHGSLTIDPVFPVVNHGTVEAVAGDAGAVRFTPEEDFTGLADFNYIACDSIGTCATGSVTVAVNPIGATFNDEVRLATGANTSKSIPVPFKVKSVDPALEVKIEQSECAVVYTPKKNFVGEQTFTLYGENGNQRTIVMEVLERPVNAISLAKEDIRYAALGESVTLNVLENDQMTTVNVLNYLSVIGGTIETVGDHLNGEIIFTPDEGFRGVARIYYRVFDAGYEEHLGEAYIIYDRNNFAPNVRDYEYTFRLNPGQSKVFDYHAPIDNYRLFPTAGFDNVIGEVSSLTEKTVEYIAPEEAGATDEFELSYCVGDDCQPIKIRIETVEETVADCSDDCVFPGDVNQDGQVNSIDLLPLGLQIGTKGAARSKSSTSFEAQEAADWDMTYADNQAANLKHYDTNGDGIISEKDAEVIQQNYGQVNQIIAGSIPAISKGIAIIPHRTLPDPIFIPAGEPIPAGNTVQFDIVIGEEDLQELDIYGFTFPFKINGRSFIDLESFEVTFNNDSWAALNSPTLNLAQESGETDSELVEFDLAFTRTSRVAVSGQGLVATVNFVVISDIAGIRLPDEIVNLSVEAGAGYAIDGNGRYYQYEGVGEIALPITFAATEQEEELAANQLRAYPNPVADEINVALSSYNYHINAITLHTITGQEVYHSASLDTRNVRVPVHNLAEGLYIMNVQTDGGMLTEKVEVLRRQ